MKFDSDRTDDIGNLNLLLNKAAPYFNSGGYVYFSDCLRDLEALNMCGNGDIRYWIVGETCTGLVNNEHTARLILNENAKLLALFRVECVVRSYGRRTYTITLIDAKAR